MKGLSGVLSPNIKRVFIVDPAISDWVGHHAVYDLTVRDAIRESGRECVIVGNRNMNFGDAVPEGIIPVFSNNSWGKRTASTGDVGDRGWVLIIANALCFLAATLALSPYIALTWMKRWAFRSEKRTAAWRRTAETLRFAGNACLGAVRLILPLAVVKFLAAATRVAKDSPYAPPVAFGINWIAACPLIRNYYELTTALEKAGFGKGDLLFTHMVSGTGASLWAIATHWAVRRKHGEACVLFRYPVRFIVPVAKTLTRFSRVVAMRSFAQEFISGGVLLATDSDLLAKDYAEALPAPLVTFPIPHTHEEPAPSRRTPGTRLRCVSLGNARAEKGIREIFNALEILRSEGHADKFLFDLQVNDPDDESAMAVEWMRGQIGSDLALRNESLSPVEYRALLESADVVLVPYFSHVYASRTSGVFLEAAAAGKPVVVIAGTWMEYEAKKNDIPAIVIDECSGKAIADALVKLYDEYKAVALQAETAGRTLRAFHNPKTFVEKMLLPDKAKPIAPGDSLLMIYPHTYMSMGYSGSEQRVLLLKRLLEDNGYKLDIMSIQGGANNPHVVLWETAIRFFTALRLNGMAYQFWLLRMFFRSRRYWPFLHQFTEKLLGGKPKALLVEYAFDVDVLRNYASALGIPMIATAHDLHHPACSVASVRDYVEKRELGAMKTANSVMTVADFEHKWYREHGVENTCAPSCSDIAFLEFMPKEKARAAVEAHIGRGLRENVLFFIGSNHVPNRAAAKILRNLSLSLWMMRPGFADVILAGACWPKMVVENFISLGTVDETLKHALYNACTLFVSPLPQGTGASVKTVEAMGNKTVILGTSHTFRGLEVVSGVHAFVSDDIPGYAKTIGDILARKNLLAAVGENARKLALRYDYRTACKPYLDFVNDWGRREKELIDKPLSS